MKRAIVNCHMVDVEEGDIKTNMTIVWENETIIEIGQHVDLNSCADVIDGTGYFVSPGLVNGYTHLGLKEVGVRWEGNDAYEASGLVQPSLSVIDGIYPFDKGFEMARSAGVTTAHVCPGPENIIGGLSAIIKTYGKVIDDMVVKKNQGLSVSLGDIPIKAYYNQTKKALTRMGVASTIRKKLTNALYSSSKDNGDQEVEVFKKILKREIPLYVVAHRSDDILTAIRLKEEFSIEIVLIGLTESTDVMEKLRLANISVLTGPFYRTKTREELKKLSPYTAVELNEATIPYGIVTPSVRNLSLEGALVERAGLTNMEAIYALTLGAANILGIADQIGSIKVGKTADLVIWDGEPLELTTPVHETICDGLTVYKRGGFIN